MLAVTDFFKSCLKKEWLINEKHGQGTHSTEMGVDKSVENTPNAPVFICSNCQPKPPKKHYWASVVCG